MGTSYSSKLFSEFPQFVFDESDELAEMKSRWNPTGSGKKKFRSGYSPVDNYTFLQSLAGGKEPKGKKLRDETVIIHEDDDAVKERIVRSDTALQSSSSDYISKSFAGSKSSDFITPKPLKAPTQRFCLADNEPVSLISDEDSDTSSEMSSNDLADTQGSSGEQSLVQEITSQEMEPSVVLHPKYTTYEGNCYWSAKLTFLPSSIKLDVSEEEAPVGPLTYEWKTVDLICIESKWLDPFPTADVCLHFKLEHPKQPSSDQKSGILKVNFTVCDPNWDSMQELIKSLDEQYKEKWEVDLDSYELFEDITYRGDCDSISISKRDFQLLHPEKFINDTIVDFYIEYLKKINPADERVHFFNSFFFRKLADFDENQLQMFDAKESFQRVRKWTKKVDIFQKDYIFIPVNFRLHWSLIIICHPGEVVSFEDEELEVSVKVPCILHMDSIKGSHRGIENCIKCYLWEEWKQRSSNRAEDISTKFKNLRFLCLEVPQQQNSYDCGLFMLHYMELFMKQAPSSFNPLSNFISKDWFFPTEASLKRGRIKRLIIELAKSKSEQALSPSCNDEFSSEDKDVVEEESEDVEILNETCHGRSSTPIMVKPLRSEPYKSDCEELGDDEDSLIDEDDDDEQNHGKLVLYDPSVAVAVAVLSPTKESNAKEEVDNEKQQVSGKNESESFMTCLDKSLNLLQLKERNQPEEDVDVFVVEKKEESDDDVFETCVVEDSDSDDVGGHLSCYRRKFASSSSSSSVKSEEGRSLQQQAPKRRHDVVSQAQKRLRRNPSTDLQIISLCE
ncbi:unnamed protein product [Lactuca virosa]|uniref:Ubiquitin-like protease family profile domain-containing protein n=1 Tax=Lactuca virosa TaxID=75947 RepID=A0AAU9MDU8_9ASTR|nr:unnamed protein product [Lactuca virosa]